jgi:hypothetical protein
MAYKIYKEVNYADTCRDADNIRTTDLGYKHKLKDALEMANGYIKNHFFHKDTELHKCKDSNDFQATDFCSYGATIYVKEIKID